MVSKRRKNKEEFVVTIGSLLKDILEKQKENIKKVTYGCVKASDYEAGELIAKKIIENKLI